MSEFELPRQVEDPGASHAKGRRVWLRAFVGLFGLLPWQLSLFAAPVGPQRENLDQFLRRLGDGAVLSRLGATYIASHPEAGDSLQLSRLLFQDPTKPLRLVLIADIAQDWANHEVTVVDGWILARTEARICALLHLTDGWRA